jgi:hypothetical protein
MLTETFHQLLERSLNNKFSSRPPKVEISGVLAPTYAAMNGKVFRFKIVTDATEYYLHLNSELSLVAKKMEWEDVTAKGTLDLETNVFTAERLTLKHSPDDLQTGYKPSDSNFDLDFYNKTIAQIGRLEPEPSYLAS